MTASASGEDGAAHQPVEQLASLRAMPGVAVFRPADAVETAECWELALRRTDGPSLLVLSRQAVPACGPTPARTAAPAAATCLIEADGPRQATLIATGSEVAVALEARRLLAETGIAGGGRLAAVLGAVRRAGRGYRADVLGAALAGRHRGRVRLRLGTLARAGRASSSA